MPAFLYLPREIRNAIFEIILLDELNVQRPTRTRVKAQNTYRDPNDVSAKKIRYPSTIAPKSHVSRLLLLNRQIYHETREAIEHHCQTGHAHLTLDLLVGQNKWLFPTWIQVLPYMPTVKSLRVCMRPFMDDDMATAHDGFNAWWHFGNLLTVILMRGPDFNFNRSAKPFIVQELVVDIIVDKSLERIGGSEDELIERADELRSFIAGHHHGLMTTRLKREDAPWGPVTMSRVRRMKVIAEGKEVINVDLEAKANSCAVGLLAV